MDGIDSIFVVSVITLDETRSTMNNIERLITEQVLTWSNREFKPRHHEEYEGEWPVITISREFGAYGRSLANELGRLTGFKVWDKELLSAIAEEAGADERFLSTLDERRRKMVDDFLYGSLMGSKHSNTHYFRSLVRVVHTIGAHGKSIIVGRGSNFIIQSPMALHVRVVRPIEERIAFVAEREGTSEKNAEKIIQARDDEREDFIKYCFKHGAQNPLDYDLVLNSGTFDTHQLADLVLTAYENKVGKKFNLRKSENLASVVG